MKRHFTAAVMIGALTASSAILVSRVHAQGATTEPPPMGAQMQGAGGQTQPQMNQPQMGQPSTAQRPSGGGIGQTMGMHPGMMGMHQGPGMMGQGMMGPGMMGYGGMGPGSGPGMGRGMGPGMMGPGMGQGMGRGMGPGMMMGQMHGGEMLAPMIEGRLAFVKTALNITDAQAQAWNEFASTVRSHVGDIQGMMQDMAAMHEGPMPQRIDLHIKHMSNMLDALKALKGPVDNLYGSLSEEQRRKADMLAGMGPMG